MWVCPKCGRSFKNMNQSHYCGEKPKTIDEYISVQDKEQQVYLVQVRKAIHEAIPEAEEKFPGVCRLSGNSIISFILLQTKSISVSMLVYRQ